MSPEDLVAVVRGRWIALSCSDARFVPWRATVAVAASSLLCPSGWCGIVTIAGATIATAATEEQGAALSRALATLPVDSHTDPSVLRTRVAIRETMGPASLAYATPDTIGGLPLDAEVQAIPARDVRVRKLLDDAGRDDAGESGLADISSDAFVALRIGVVVAAAGYEVWRTGPAAIAHLCVLTASRWRAQGLARAVAARAAADADRHGFLCQWRAGPAASRRVATALGFLDLGAQVSVRMRGDEAPRPGAA